MELFLIILLYVVGLGLVLAEMMLPGVVLGLLGMACLVTGIVMGFRSNEPLGWTLLGLSGVLVPILIVVWIKILHHVLAVKTSEAGVSTRDDEMAALVGREGVAVSALRPAGVARIDGRRVDVVSQGDMIDPGVRVAVIEVKGNRVVVRKSAL